MGHGYQNKDLTPEERQQKRDEYVNICIKNSIESLKQHTKMAKTASMLENRKDGINYGAIIERAEKLQNDPENEKLQNDLFEYLNSANKKTKYAYPDFIKTLDVYLEYKFARKGMNGKVIEKLNKEIDKQVDLRQVLIGTKVVRKGVGEGRKDVTENLSDALSKELGILKKVIGTFNETKVDSDSKEFVDLKESATAYAKKLSTIKKHIDNKAFTNIPKKLSEAGSNREAFVDKLNAYIEQKHKEYTNDPQGLKSDVKYVTSLNLLKVNADYKNAVVEHAMDNMNIEQEQLEAIAKLEQEKEAQRIYQLHLLLAMKEKKEEYELGDILLDLIDEIIKADDNARKEIRKMIEEEDELKDDPDDVSLDINNTEEDKKEEKDKKVEKDKKEPDRDKKIQIPVKEISAVSLKP